MSGFLDKLKNAVTSYENAVGYDPNNFRGTASHALNSYQSALGFSPSSLSNYSFMNFLRDVGSFGNHGNGPLPTWPQTINNPLAAREQQRLLPQPVLTTTPLSSVSPSLPLPLVTSPQVVSSGATTSNTTPTSTTSPDAHTDSSWYNDPHYAVVSQLSRDEYVKPFASADGYKIIRSTTKIVLDKLKNKGYTITPDMYQQLEAAAIPASKIWVNQRKAAGQDRSSIEYYLMLTDLALSHVVQPLPGTSDNTLLTPDQTIPAQQEGTTIHVIDPVVDPSTGKSYGTGDVHIVGGINNTYSVDGFDKWAKNNQDLFQSSPNPAAYQDVMKNLYTIWVTDTLKNYPQADVSPEAWEEYHGYKAWNKDNAGG